MYMYNGFHTGLHFGWENVISVYHFAHSTIVILTNSEWIHMYGIDVYMMILTL